MLRREFIALLGSAAIARPLLVLAEQGKVTKIGVLLLGYPDPSLFIKGLREGLHDLGYEEGRSIELIIRSADGKPEALASLAADLIRSQVNIIVAYPTTAGLAAQKATAELPIVVYGGDLEATGLIANLARPGGNVTGVSAATAELAAKNLELIAEILPVTRRVAVFVNAASLFGAALLEHVQVAAQTRNIEIKSFPIREPGELEADPKSAGPRHRWVIGSLYRFPPQPPNLSVVGSVREEVIGAASALEIGLKQHIFIPPFAEASCGAIDIRIAKVTAKAMLRPLSGDLPDVRVFMMILSRRS
jgi:hypothetical protein